MVVPTISNQEKIEAIVAELHGQDEFPYQSLCDLMFAVIDQFCESLKPQTGPGRRKTYPDSAILKIDMLIHGRIKDLGEEINTTSILSYTIRRIITNSKGDNQKQCRV